MSNSGVKHVLIYLALVFGIVLFGAGCSSDLIKEEPTQNDLLKAPAANLAQGYLVTKTRLRIIERQVKFGSFSGSGARFILKSGGETIDKDNVDEHLAKTQKQLSLYEEVIRQRGSNDLSGIYQGEATESCSRSNSIFAATIQARKHGAIEIRQNNMNALVVVSVLQDDGEFDVSNPAAVVESALAVIESTNSDYYFRGQFNNDVIEIRPDVSVLNTWPKWANPPSRSDLEECVITLK